MIGLTGIRVLREIVAPSPALIGRRLFAVYTSRSYMPPKLRSFIDFLSLRLGDASHTP